jgi:16S rRNA (guanine527-N7)-methyltransferase
VNARSQRSGGDNALSGIVGVSHGTLSRLTRLVELVETWHSAENLIATSTLPDIWRRHVADSAQLVPLFPEARDWVDLGSGAGFPGLVVAILLAEKSCTVHLLESNQRKCAFLRVAVRETGAPAIVHDGRIEATLANWREPVDIVTARALAPLSGLLTHAAPLIHRGARAAFFKGRDFVREIEEASKYWDFDLVQHPSKTNESGVILEIRRVAAKKAVTELRGLA